MNKNVIKISLLIIVALSFHNVTHSQNKQDYIWLLGQGDGSPPENIGYRFDFNNNPYSIEAAFNGFGFASSNASICDKDGNLLFYTNGCAVLNKNSAVMPNGDSLNYDIFMELFNWDDCSLGYPGFQDNLILKDPANENGYYLIHKAVIHTAINEPRNMQMRISYIDMDLDNGLGDVVYKNISLSNTDNPLFSFLSAIQHSNGTDWWIIQAIQNDSIFSVYLLDENGIQRTVDQNSKELFTRENSSAAGTAKFSPDGNQYALYTYDNNLQLYDFNRETGLLSNHKKIVIYDAIDPSDSRFTSIEWSPSSQFIYVAARDDLFQIDAAVSDPQTEVVLIDSYNGTVDPFATNFFLMAQAPDCKIYMCPTSSTNSYHIIHNPDEKGVACNFAQNGVILPKTSGLASLPNFPRFRVDNEEKCDPSILSILGETVYDKLELTVFPSPTNDKIQIELPNQIGSAQLIIYDFSGSVFHSEIISERNNITIIEIDVSTLPAGIFNIEILPSDNSKRIIYGQQFIKQ